MILLHAGIHKGKTVLWAERATSDAEAQVTPTTRGNQQHPFSATAYELAHSLGQLVEKGAKAEESFTSVSVWLPSSDHAPLPSSQLIADKPLKHLPVGLKSWNVPGLILSPGQLSKMLLTSSNQHVFAPGVLLSDEFQYLSLALQFAVSVAVRQQYLPGIVEHQGAYFAKWQPIFLKDDQARLAELAQMMPPVVRALEDVDAPLPTTAPSASTVLRQYMEVLVDEFVRMSFEVSAKAKATVRFDSVHDCWMHALQSKTGVMSYDTAELLRLRDQIAEWQEPVTAIEAAPYRLCFRMHDLTDDDEEEPPPKNAESLPTRRALSMVEAPRQQQWTVSYWLQDKQDQSLMIPARVAWKNRTSSKSTFSNQQVKPREFLLLSLAQASRLSTEVAESLRSNAPDGFNLDANSAISFLTQTAGALEQAGFGVMLPPWWKKKNNLRYSVKASTLKPGDKTTPKGHGLLSLDSALNFNWKVALGDVELSLAELTAIANLKQSLVRIRGQWTHVNSDEIKAAIEFLKQQRDQPGTVRDAMLMSIGAFSPLGDGEEVHVEVEGDNWLDELLQNLNQPSRLQPVEAPAGFVGELRPYQERGLAWLAFLSQWQLGACLADDMGLGKTIQTLALLQRNVENGLIKPTLLVCPTSVLNNWRKEAERFTPGLKVHLHHGAKRKKEEKFISVANEHNIVITSYALLSRDWEFLRSIDWAGVVLDEAQNIKNAETLQSQAARVIGKGFKIALTGTPVENTVGELWAIMDFLNPGFLGSQSAFRKNFFYPIQVDRNAEAKERLKGIAHPFILRRLKTDKSIITDLPDKQEMKVFCSLTKEQATLYSAVLRDIEQKLTAAQSIQRKGLIIAMLTRLKQVCNHPAQYFADHSGLSGRSGKLQRLEEMIEEVLQTNDRALIFSQFAVMGGMIKRQLEERFGEEVLFLYGGVAKEKRDEMVERFQSKDGPRLFVLSLKAGGTGLNLTAANHVFHFDRWWNPAVENQATDRAFRIGQTKNVQVHKFICAGTFEERIDELIESKRQLAEDVIGAGEAWLTELSNDELKRIFALSKEALME